MKIKHKVLKNAEGKVIGISIEPTNDPYSLSDPGFKTVVKK